MPYGDPNGYGIPGVSPPNTLMPRARQQMGPVIPSSNSQNPLEILMRLLEGGGDEQGGNFLEEIAQMMSGGQGQMMGPEIPEQNPLASFFGGGDTSGTPNTSQNGLESLLLGPMQQEMGPVAPQLTPEQMQLQQLSALNDMLMGSIGSAEGLEEALAQASQGINQQYGSQINLLKQQNQGARQDTKAGTKEIRQMYAALRRDYNRASRDENKQGRAAAQRLENLGTRQSENINSSANDLLLQNAAAAAGLESPELAAELNAKVVEQSQGAGERAITDAGREAALQEKYTSNDAGYLRGQGANVLLEGTNRSSDLIGQLQDYLQMNRAKIGDIAGQRAQALAQAQSQIQGSFQDNSAQVLNQVFDNALAMANLNMAMNRANKSQGGNAFEDLMPEGLFKSDALMSGATPQLQEIFRGLSDNRSIVNNSWADAGGQELSGNIPLLTKYVADHMTKNPQDFGGTSWNTLGPGNQKLLISALAQLLEGSPKYNDGQ